MYRCLGLVACITCLLFSNSYAAELLRLDERFADYPNLKTAMTEEQIANGLGLGNEEQLTLISSRSDAYGNTHERYQQYFRGVPVWGYEIIVHRNSSGVYNVTGVMAQGLDYDFAGKNSHVPTFAPGRAIAEFKRAKLQRKPDVTGSRYSGEESALVIYIDGEGASRLAYDVAYYAEAPSQKPEWPRGIVAADTLELLSDWEQVNDVVSGYESGSGRGGNLKTGLLVHTNIPVYAVKSSATAADCYMKSPAGFYTFNLNHQSELMTPQDTQISGISYPNAFKWSWSAFGIIPKGFCENTYQTINGAYSPINDVHKYGNLVLGMYSSLVGSVPFQLPLGANVHFGNNYENAFWDGKKKVLYFGDGGTTYYPFTSLDVVSHEIAHAVTDANSRLTYKDQSGGISEAYSDMAGKAAEYFVRGANDWRFGFEITKDPARAIRYMSNPESDGHSIGHASKYVAGMDPHYSSGVMNRAFYLLSTKTGWNTWKAFKVMTDANMHYWFGTSTFQDAACGAGWAAQDMGYSRTDVLIAFASVGVVCSESTKNGPTSFSITSTTVKYSWMIAQSVNIETKWKALASPDVVAYVFDYCWGNSCIPNIRYQKFFPTPPATVSFVVLGIPYPAVTLRVRAVDFLGNDVGDPSNYVTATWNMVKL